MIKVHGGIILRWFISSLHAVNDFDATGEYIYVHHDDSQTDDRRVINIRASDDIQID